jgi:sodium/potassium-transporting ATPase subunit beta
MVGEPPAPMLGVTAIKPIERHGWEAISWFLYDKNTGAILGRTPKSWALIGSFYVVYYLALAAFWAIMLLVFFQTINDKQPRWMQGESLIGTSPAVGVRPGPAADHLESSMIIFNHKVQEDREKKLQGWGGWQNRTATFFHNYYDVSAKGFKCGKDKTCKFIASAKLGPCGSGNFGYDKGKPCVILKLNKIIGLVPTWFNDTNNLPPDVVLPPKLKTHIDTKVPKSRRNQVWLDCDGENPADKERMGPIKYYPPDRGFPEEYFPYTNQANYQSPLVAVQFLEPPKGQLLHIECRAWAANIGYDRMQRVGKAHFELMVHTAETAKLVEEGM